MNLICAIFDHKWKCNFPKSSMPNKCICTRCKKKAQLDYSTLSFVKVDKFENDDRTDDQLIKQWF